MHNEIESIKPLPNISQPDRQKLVSVFAWLIQQDKKQNPELYKLTRKDDEQATINITH